MALYRIAQTGKASDVARAAELGRKATDGDAAFTAVDAIKAELNRETHKSLTTPAQREVAGEAADGGKAPKADDTDDVGEPAPKTRTANAGDLASVGTAALIAELASRYAGTKAGVHPDDLEALTALMSRVESLVTNGRVAGKRK